MKFLIDAHLPPSLRNVFEAAGHDAIHTIDLPERNATRDGLLNEISMSQSRVLVTKDTDFYYSHLLQGRPWKLILVRTGNLGVKATKQMFESHLSTIERILATDTMIEMDQNHISIGKK